MKMSATSVFIVLVFAGTAMGFSSPKYAPKPTAAPTAPPSPAATATATPGAPKSYPSVGWLPEYDAFVKSNVTRGMLSAPASRMTKFCSAWPSMNESQRRQFYADLLFAITKPESNYKRGSLYWEESQGTDSITGLKVKTSEGFLQISYSDVRGYGAACDFSYASHDKPLHLKDIAAKPNSHAWLSAHPNDKYILDPIRNLRCGIAIVDRLMLKNPSKEFADTLGAYWSTMRRGRDSYKSVWNQMRARNTPCN